MLPEERMSFDHVASPHMNKAPQHDGPLSSNVGAGPSGTPSLVFEAGLAVRSDEPLAIGADGVIRRSQSAKVAAS